MPRFTKETAPVTSPVNPDFWTDERKASVSQKLIDRQNTWVIGVYERKPRHQFQALYLHLGSFVTALKLHEELVLWPDERRPPVERLRYWALCIEDGSQTVPDKVMNLMGRKIKSYEKGRHWRMIDQAATAHEKLTQQIIDGNFHEKNSSTLQHLGNSVNYGVEQRAKAFDPQKKRDDAIQVTPQFFLQAPPERRQLPEGNVVEGEVVKRG